ncbi:helix-turn-helix domain-containing protein [Fodinicola feengrottensis]|uniref:Helix-turn-helix transcriptional regulator n=1 Tax=Fodinicola feengrottensis TaxID=435914 RepID=A0ABN2HB02_9ACTN|nr:helix-turn-helix transcriptional regulator [Fodinicola feengrottensis]
MVSDLDVPLGKRIELARRRRGLSRAVLAGLVGRSAEWIRQVERDERAVDRLSILLRLAEVLKISDVSGFLGSAVPLAPRRNLPRVPVNELRELLFQPELTHQPHHAVDNGQLERLRRDVIDTWTGWQDSPHRYTMTLQRLPGLLRTLAELGEAPATDGLAACTYRLVSAVLRRIGDQPLALLAIERSVQAARRTGDPLAEIACAGGFASTLLSLGFPDRARQLCLELLEELRTRVSSETVEEISVYGAMQLTAAEATAADDDQVAAERLLDQARATAGRLTEDRNDLRTGFGPTDVEIHAVRIALTFGRARHALRIAETVDTGKIHARERRARHYITVAQAHGRESNTFGAIFSLLKAEEACPEEIRFSAEARDVVQDLLARDNALVRTDLWALAERSGLA